MPCQFHATVTIAPPLTKEPGNRLVTFLRIGKIVGYNTFLSRLPVFLAFGPQPGMCCMIRSSARWFVIPAILVAPLLSTVAQAQAPAPVVHGLMTIEQLIEQLGSNEYRAREDATRNLADRGPTALPALRAAADHKDPEIRRRIEDLLRLLESSNILAPKRVSLQVKQQPIQEAVQALAKQSGYKIQLWPNAPQNGPKAPQPVLNLDLVDTPFWDALDRVSDAGGLNLQQHAFGDETLRLNLDNSYAPFRCNRGVFRVVAQGFNYGRNINFERLSRPQPNQAAPTAQGHEYLSLQMSVSVEPRMALLRVGAVTLLQAYDDQKHSLLPDVPLERGATMSNRYYYYGGHKSFCQHVHVNLAAPIRSARAVKLVRGVIPVTLLTKQEPICMTDKLLESKGKKFQAGTVTIEVEDVIKNPNQAIQLKLAITDLDKRDPNDYSRIHSMYQRVEVQDENGVKFQASFNSISTNSPSQARVTLTCEPTPQGGAPKKQGSPTRLVYNSWSTMEHEVEFEFRDLPLP